MSPDQIKKLKKEVEEAGEEAARAAGALDQLYGELKREFGCSDLKSARKKLAELEASRDRARADFNKKLKDYESKWKRV